MISETGYLREDSLFFKKEEIMSFLENFQKQETEKAMTSSLD